MYAATYSSAATSGTTGFITVFLALFLGRWVRRWFSTTGFGMEIIPESVSRTSFEEMFGSSIYKSYSCPKCQRRWPLLENYAKCPYDRKSCVRSKASPTIPPTIALKIHREKLAERKEAFDRHYQDHCEKRRTMGYPLPEEVGRMQAKRSYAEWRAIEEAWEASEDAEGSEQGSQRSSRTRYQAR